MKADAKLQCKYFQEEQLVKSDQYESEWPTDHFKYVEEGERAKSLSLALCNMEVTLYVCDCSGWLY